MFRDNAIVERMIKRMEMMAKICRETERKKCQVGYSIIYYYTQSCDFFFLTIKASSTAIALLITVLDTKFYHFASIVMIKD